MDSKPFSLQLATSTIKHLIWASNKSKLQKIAASNGDHFMHHLNIDIKEQPLIWWEEQEFRKIHSKKMWGQHLFANNYCQEIVKINLFQRNEIPCYIIFVQNLNFWKCHLYSKITVTQTNTIDAPRSPTQMVRLISCIKSMWSTYLVHFTQFNAGTAAFKSLHLPLNELLFVH